MRMVEIPCLVADVIRQHPNVKCYSSLTNYFEGDPEATDPRLPAVTNTVWAVKTSKGLVRVLEDTIDVKGCRHWAMEPTFGDEDYYPTGEGVDQWHERVSRSLDTVWEAEQVKSLQEYFDRTG